ncbi:LuxR C-terminal-related transcriptional regulator [Arcanobacterium hippocoleae]
MIKQVYTGINVMSPRPAQLVADIYLKAQINHENYQDFIDAVEQLPSHLRIVFDRIIKAKTNKTIAGELGLSETTIRSYVSDIFSATGFSSRAELTVTAIKAGY